MSGPVISSTIRLTDEFSPALKAIVANLDAFSAALRADTNNKQEVFDKLSISAQHLAQQLRVIDQDTRTVVTAGKGLSSEFNRAANETQRMKGDMSSVLRDAGSVAEKLGNIVNGLAALGVANKIVDGIKHVLEQGADVSTGQAKLINTGATKDEINQHTEHAKRIGSQYSMTTPARAMEDVVELRAQTIDMGGVVDPAKLDAMTEATAKQRQRLAGSGLDFAPGDLRAVSQAAEATGHAGDEAFFQKTLERLTSAAIMYNNPNVFRDFQTYIRNAKSSGIAISDDELLGKYVIRAATEQAARLGNEQSQTMNTLVGGKMTKQAAMRLVDAGLINAGQIKSGEGGKFYIDGGIKDSDMLNSHPFEWTNEVFAPAIEKLIDPKAITAGTSRILEDAQKAQGAHLVSAAEQAAAEKKSYEQQIAAQVAQFGFRGTVQDNLVHQIANEHFIKRETAQLERMDNIGENDALSQNAAAAMTELQTAFNGLLQTLAEPAMGDIAGTLHTVATELASFGTSIADFEKSHPDLTKALLGNSAAAAGGIAAGISVYSITQLFAAGPALTAAAAELSVAAVELGAAGVAGKAGAVAGGAIGAAEGGLLSLIPGFAKSGIGRFIGNAAFKGMALYNLASDGFSLLNNWEKMSGNEKAWGAFDATADAAALKSGAFGPLILGAKEFFDFVHKNGENFKWKTTEEQDTQAAIDRQNKLFQQTTGYGSSGQLPAPSSIKPDNMTEAEWSLFLGRRERRLKADRYSYEQNKSEIDAYDARRMRLDRVKGDDVLPPIKAAPIEVKSEVSGKAQVEQHLSVDVGLDARTTKLIRSAVDVGLQDKKAPVLPGTSLTGPQGVK